MSATVRQRLIALVAFAWATAILTSSCSFLGFDRARNEPPKPLPIPRSAVVPADDEIVYGEMRMNNPCVYLIQRTQDGLGAGGPDILPIWPTGFTIFGGPSGGLFLHEALGKQYETTVAGAELMELHGRHLSSPPPDAVVPPECSGYPLFLVSRVFNITDLKPEGSPDPSLAASP